MTRIPEGLRRKLEREADQNRCSMNAEIIRRLESSFRREETQQFAQALNTVLGGVQDNKQQLVRLTAPPPTTLLDLGHLPAPAPIVSDVRDIKSDVRDIKEMLKTFLQQGTNKGENPK